MKLFLLEKELWKRIMLKMKERRKWKPIQRYG